MKTRIFLLLIAVFSSSPNAIAKKCDHLQNSHFKKTSNPSTKKMQKPVNMTSPKNLDSFVLNSDGIQKAPYSPNQGAVTRLGSGFVEGPFTYYAIPSPKFFPKQEWDSAPTQLRMIDHSRRFFGIDGENSTPPFFGSAQNGNASPPPPMIPLYEVENLTRNRASFSFRTF